MPEKPTYISTIAKELGISPKTVRWYESQGLLDEPERTESGYRTYHAEDIERLKFIRKAFAFGFSSKEIKDILELRAHGESPCDLVVGLIGDKIAAVQQQIKQLQQLERELTGLRKQWKIKQQENALKNTKVCTCIEDTDEPKKRRING